MTNNNELKHIKFLEDNASECCLFLKKDNNFPLTKPCKLALIGNGARNTIKGGTGSGDVYSRFFVTCEAGLKEAGFDIVSTNWMASYDAFKKSTKKSFIKHTKKEARKHGYLACVYSMGYFEEEKNHDISCEYDADACIYVLSRNSGEGNDRRNIKGDVKLSDKEVNDILYLNSKFDKFLLVLNVGGVVDLSEVLGVKNILLLSQLGVVTGKVLTDIVLGHKNPSGKLSTTWAKPEYYPFFNEFGDLHNTNYLEGLYVGYRYFSSLDNNLPFYSFGYGLSYTDFKLDNYTYEVNSSVVKVSLDVTNIGNFSGKEVVQVYLTKPNDYLDNPKLSLSGYVKTDELKPGETKKYSVSFDLCDNACYDTRSASYILPSGNYYVHVGNASNNLSTVVKLVLNDTCVIKQLNNKCGSPSFTDYSIKSCNEYDCDNVVTLDLTDIKKEVVTYKKDEYTSDFVKNLSDKELSLLCLGHHGTGFAAVIGSSCKNVIGGAGETCLAIPSLTKSLTMADGPAGLRIKQSYGVDDKGIYDISMDAMMEKMLDFLPKLSRVFMAPPKNRHGKVYEQNATAIPIGTALAQSFNNEFVEEIGMLVAREMDSFNVDLWLAPALNIHRNILCGRNFEYYSEDPYLSGMIASYMTKGVQKSKGRGVTIKHFACNNQEINRNNNSSNVSERALREIYLRGFEICIKEANPLAIMTSYNLINGIHASESFELCNDILRCEWNYDGLIMTDWISSGRSFCMKSKYPAPYASKNILAGNDLTMSGAPSDERDIKKALRRGVLTRDDLIYSASRIYRAINRQK